MWKKYLLSGVAAVFILANASGVTHATEMSDGGQPINVYEATAVWEQDTGVGTPETVQEETYETARNTSGTYRPYEGAKYSLRYEVKDEGVVITGIADYESKYNLGRLEIPTEIDGMKVTSIGYMAFYDCSGLTGSLTIPEGVTSIGDNTFNGCSGLTGSLTIPESVTSIGRGAFTYCSGLTGSLTIPEGVTSIGNHTFYGCSGLTGSLTIPESVMSIGYMAFRGCSGLMGSLTILEGVTSIGDYAFEDCSGLTGSLTIPKGVTSIGDYAFEGCSGLTGSLTILEGVTSIGAQAFYGCSSLTGNLTLPESVISIGERAFQSCSGLTGGLTIPKGVTSIESNVFRDCKGFTGSLTIPEGVTSIGSSAFSGCSGFTGSLTIPEGVTNIGGGAFADCSGLTGSLTIPEGVTDIGAVAFYRCSSLTGSLLIPESVISIGNNAFYGCSGLTGGLTLPKSVTSIGEGAFWRCSGFTGSLTIPESVTSIGKRAFYGCSGFTSLTISESLTNIGEGAFEGCNFGMTTEPTYDAKGLAERFYTELLGRVGEADGIAGWTEKLETGELSAIFVGYFYVDGDEFKNLNLTNDEYIERLYKTFMGRESDPDGKAYWLERLDAGFTRDYIYLNFAVLPEFTEICEKSHIRRGETDEIGKLKEASEAYANQNLDITKYVKRCYAIVLNGRPADADGIEFWSSQIITRGQEAKAIAEFFVQSEEFKGKNTTDEEYVDVLYQAFFGRQSDSAGALYWLGQLSGKTMTRDDVLHAFSATTEFAEILAGFGL